MKKSIHVLSIIVGITFASSPLSANTFEVPNGASLHVESMGGSSTKLRSTGAFGIQSRDATPIQFFTGNQSRLAIAPSGNVGIGTGNPTKELHIEGVARIGEASKSSSYINFEPQNGFHRLAFNQLRFWDWDSAKDVVTFNNGNVGIGTTAPSYNLDILSKEISGGEALMRMRISDAPSDFFDIKNGTSSAGQFLPVVRGQVSTGRQALYILGSITEDTDSGSIPIIEFNTRTGSNPVSNRPLFAWSSFMDRKMTMNANGNLGIGVDDPQDKLEVNGTIRTKEIIVEDTGWADFVFEDDYNLRSLNEVENHIEAHGHLPDVPSAASVKSEGLSIGQTQKIMMQKIEELTLYVIAQEKEMKAQEKEIKELKVRVGQN